MAITGCTNCRQLHRPQDAPLTPCSVCNTVLYCSRRCQNEDWAIHGQFCNKGGEAPIADNGFRDNQGHYYCHNKVYPARTVVVTKFGESLHHPRGRYGMNILEGKLLEEARNVSWEEFHRLSAKVRDAVAHGGGKDALRDERWVQWILDSMKARQGANVGERMHNQTATDHTATEQMQTDNQQAPAKQNGANRQRATEQMAAEKMAAAEQKAAAAQQKASETMAAAQRKMEEQMAKAQQQMAAAQQQMATAQRRASEQMAAAAVKQAEAERKVAGQMAAQNQQQGHRPPGNGQGR